MTSIGQIFVPGGLPRVTYVPRESFQLEGKVRDYLDERHKILSIAGSTKSGKTVLLKTVAKNAIWITGGNLDSVRTFWSTIVDHLMPYQSTNGNRNSTRPAHLSAADLLRETGRPIVIDDFHYIDPTVQIEIIRGMRELIFEGIPLILASVPHRAYDAVRVEKEMTGRVEQLLIPNWSEEELGLIASSGFEELNLSVSDEIVSRLTEEAFSSPLLMQDFCLQLCKANGVRRSEVGTVPLRPPHWDSFFSDRASAASKTAFDLLIQGPRQRTDRIPRELNNGTTVDIYGAVLAAMAATGPITEIDYITLRNSLREIMKSEVPQTQEVTRVLERMSNIAREKMEGEPVVDYDADRNTLFISDPFFAFYLRWGAEAPLTAARTGSMLNT